MIEQPEIYTAGPTAWLFLGATALSVVAGLLLPRPKANRGDDRPPTLVQRGQQVPYVLGRRIVSMNPVWVGRRFTRRERAAGGKKGSVLSSGPKQVNFFESSVHVLGLGPMSKLHRIMVGTEDVIFEGPVSPQDTPSGTSLTDNEGNVFKIYWGEANQPINEDLADDESGIGAASRWPYICYVHWINRRLGGSAFWPQIDYDVEATCIAREPLPDSECDVPESSEGEGDGGMNAAHMLFQLISGSYPHGGGVPSDWINWTTLRSLGRALEAEALAQNVLIIDDKPLQDVVSEILADAGVFLADSSGTMAFLPVRDGDDAVEAEGNVIVDPRPELDVRHGPATGTGGERIVFTFQDVQQFFRQSDFLTDDDATAIARRRKNSRDVPLPTITHEKHAAVVADRRKSILLTESNQIKASLNRTMRRIEPGRVVRIENVGDVRVSSVSPSSDGLQIEIRGSVDRFLLPSSLWNPVLPRSPRSSALDGPDSIVRVIEAPRTLVGDRLALAVIRGREDGLDVPASVLVSTNGVSFEDLGDVADVGSLGSLQSAWNIRPVGFDFFRLVPEQVPNVTFLVENAQKLLDLSDQDDDWRSSRQVMLIGDEILSVRRFHGIGGGVFSPSDVIREQLFTRRQQHAAGSPVLVFEPGAITAISRPSWRVGQTIWVKVVPSGVAVEDVEAISINLTGKALGPPPIENFGPVMYQQFEDVTFSWSYRINAGTGLASGELPAGSPIPAPTSDNVEFTVRVLSSLGVVVRSVSVSSPEWEYSSSDRFDDGLDGGNFIVEVTATLSGFGGYPVRTLVQKA